MENVTVEKNRCVDKLVSIFHLSHCEAPTLPDNTHARVMLVYDKKENIRELKVLSKGLTLELNQQIKSCLEEISVWRIGTAI